MKALDVSADKRISIKMYLSHIDPPFYLNGELRITKDSADSIYNTASIQWNNIDN